jgi:quercetin dioxygenase-like cupin family protein
MKNETIRIGRLEIKFLLEAADTNGSVAMFAFMMPVGAKVPMSHSHIHYHETIYGVQGVLTFTFEGKTVPIGPGESSFIRRDAVHGFKNREPEAMPSGDLSWAKEAGWRNRNCP